MSLSPTSLLGGSHSVRVEIPDNTAVGKGSANILLHLCCLQSNLKAQNSKITWSEGGKKCGDYNFATNLIFLSYIWLDFLQIDTL